MLVEAFDPFTIENIHQRRYMLNFLEIVTTVSSVLLLKAGTPEHLQKKEDLWAFIEKTNPRLYQTLRRRILGRILYLPGKFGRSVALTGYRISRKIFGFN